MRAAVGYVFDELYLQHDTGSHPENAQRLVAVREHLAACGLLEQLRSIPARPATEEELLRVHAPELIARVRDTAARGGGFMGLDNVLSAKTYEAAVMAAGGAIAATEAVLRDDVSAAFALLRPPGHHATRSRALGFCFFNNIAVAAAWALDAGLAERVAIVDYDVHHGNGTEEIFAEDPRVLYVSLHQYPLYPGTGHWRDKGRGAGEGSCLNIPLPPQTGDAGYRLAFDQLVVPALRRLHPDLLLGSAGYDAHWADPLSWMLLSLAGYRYVADALVSLADELCDGRLALVLEGGYRREILAHGVATTLSAMLRQPYDDPYGPAKEPETSIEGLIRQIAAYHGL